MPITWLPPDFISHESRVLHSKFEAYYFYLFQLDTWVYRNHHSQSRYNRRLSKVVEKVSSLNFTSSLRKVLALYRSTVCRPMLINNVITIKLDKPQSKLLVRYIRIHLQVNRSLFTNSIKRHVNQFIETQGGSWMVNHRQYVFVSSNFRQGFHPVTGFQVGCFSGTGRKFI